MQTRAPEFMEWVDVTLDGWKLRDDAPADVRRDFDAFMRLFEPVKE